MSRHDTEFCLSSVDSYWSIHVVSKGNSG